MASAGEPFRGLSASDWAKARAAGQWYERQRRTSQPNQQTPIPRGAYPVLVKNTTGSDLTAGACVELTGTALTAFDRDHLWFNGASRSGNCPPFAVLVAACPNGDYGEAVTCGEVLALVDVQDTDNTHARFTAGGTTLKGCFGGPVELLVKPTSTGSQMIPVRMGATQTIVRRAKAAEDIASGASGDVNVYLNGSSKGTITAYNDWDAGDVTNNDELRIIYHHDADKWEILTRGGAAAVEGVMFWDGIERGVGSSLPRGGGYASSEYYTFDYQKVRGDAAANHLTPLDAYSAGLPFVQVDQDGSYELSMDMRFAVTYNGTDTETYTTSGPSTGTSHTHTVTVWRGKEMFPLVLLYLEYQVGGSGSWTQVPRSEVRQTAIAALGFQTGTKEVAVSCRRIVNLTSGWTIRQRLGMQSSSSVSDHQFVSANSQAVMLRYLGPTFSDTSV